MDSQFGAELLHGVGFMLVFTVLAVREVNSCDIHSGKDQFRYYLLGVGSRSEGADYFGFSHCHVSFLQRIYQIAVKESAGYVPVGFKHDPGKAVECGIFGIKMTRGYYVDSAFGGVCH